MAIIAPSTVDKYNKEIEKLKYSINKGYKFIEEANLQEHIEKSILKRINVEEEHLLYLEKKRRELISSENEAYDKAVYAVLNNW